MWPFSTPKPKLDPKADPKPDPYKLNIKTGNNQLRSGRYGIEHKIAEQMYALRHETFANISPANRQFIVDLITKHAKLLPAGTGFGRSLRLRMKEEVERARLAGKISLVDKKDFIKIIDKLPHA
ncbi:MAG: hypothetical protein A3J93_04815 [Candidatus Magasanikbacteria bacterium RIFOXYC2_FULL_42_28]|uniref:Uncharacterized protein n=1 Tax=Candidatus Magasanikbacteria bacterium RIFOXYC2_FULL_42_28 TaxID=1798704 RepID=A0A1F6NWP4_9BACT|nr:MAG: hypothetical protein A3J93_04815 [Candidatus Magasanikbacteria bacterium RIFOXYC2_FULL_42_28]